MARNVIVVSPSLCAAALFLAVRRRPAREEIGYCAPQKKRPWFIAALRYPHSSGAAAFIIR
jgi:hypothetical protein